jgi:hypothetical protein
MARDYIPSNSKDALTLLFELAEKEGRIEVISAISPFMKLSDLAYQLDTIVRNFEDRGENLDAVFSEMWRQALTRPAYSSEEVGRLLSAKLLKIPGFIDFVENVALGADVDSKYEFIDKLCAGGHHDQALRLLKSLESLDEIRFRMMDDLRHSTLINKPMAMLHQLGHYGKWNRSTLKVFDMLGIDMPADADLSKIEGGPDNVENLWSMSRFAAQVDYVGDIMTNQDIPLPKLTHMNGKPFVKDATLGEAFSLGKSHASALGGWHQEHYPQYYPAIASSREVKDLVSQGAIELRVAHDQEIEGRNGKFLAPVHAFESVGEKASDIEVRLSLSLLSNEHIAMLRETIAPDPDFTVVLVPDHFFREKANVPDELALAIRYHRPEPLKIRGQLSRRISDSLDTRLYLKGVPSAFLDVDRNYSRQLRELVKLKISTELHSDPEMLKFFNSPLERERLGDVFGKRQNHLEESQALSLRLFKPELSPSENLGVLLDTMKTYRDALGDIQFRIVAPLSFLQYMANQKLGFSEGVAYHVQNSTGYANSLADHPRLRASLGEQHQADLNSAGETPAEWVAKGVRTQDEKLKEIVAGLLDRLDIVEVAKLANTAPRMKFLASKFDFIAVSDQLPPRFLDGYITNKLETDLGL